MSSMCMSYFRSPHWPHPGLTTRLLTKSLGLDLPKLGGVHINHKLKSHKIHHTWFTSNITVKAGLALDPWLVVDDITDLGWYLGGYCILLVSLSLMYISYLLQYCSKYMIWKLCMDIVPVTSSMGESLSLPHCGLCWCTPVVTNVLCKYMYVIGCLCDSNCKSSHDLDVSQMLGPTHVHIS